MIGFIGYVDILGGWKWRMVNTWRCFITGLYPLKNYTTCLILFHEGYILNRFYVLTSTWGGETDTK